MYKSILLPIDLPHEKSQDKVVEVASTLAKTFGAKLTVMTVVPDFGMPIVGGFFPEGFEKKALETANTALHDYAKAHLADVGEVQHVVAHGSIYREILRVAKEAEADVVVMASHRPEAQDYLLGTNAARVTRHAGCSVLIVRDR